MACKPEDIIAGNFSLCPKAPATDSEKNDYVKKADLNPRDQTRLYEESN